MHYREDIEGLRAVAVILIVFFHARLASVPGGFIGVDVFFVISGFLITGMIMRDIAANQFSFRSFYLRRLRRLGPALIATLAITLIAGWFILPPPLYQSTAQAALAAVLSVSNIHFWLQTGYFDVAAAYKPLLHTWSLAVEEQFYLIWPATLLIAARLLSKAGLFAVVILVSIVSLGFSEWLLNKDASAAFYLTPFRIFAFGAGALLALAGWQARNVISANLASLSGLLVIFYLAGNLHETAPFPGVNGLLPVLGTVLMIYAGPVAVMNRAIALAPIRYIGTISYSVYLVHWPLAVYSIFVFGEAQTSTEILVLIGVTLLAGATMYHLVEVPFRHKRAGQFLVGYPALCWGSLAGVIAIVLVSWQIHTERGFPDRYAPEIRNLFSALNTAVDERAEATGEFDCNATENSQSVYFDVFDACLPAASGGFTVVLGDSHAADVFMGLRAAFPERGIVQLTGNGCNFAQPVEEKPFCAPYMAFWQDWIATNADNIDVIIYSQSGGSLMSLGTGGVQAPNMGRLRNLSDRLGALQRLSAPVIFWGPRPRLQPTIDVAIAGSTDLEALRGYYDAADFASDLSLDAVLERFFGPAEIQYVSSAKVLCDETCPTLTTDNRLFVVDYGHWTRTGAIEAARNVVASTPILQSILMD